MYFADAKKALAEMTAAVKTLVGLLPNGPSPVRTQPNYPTPSSRVSYATISGQLGSGR
jgi:hypothetical protein